MLLANVPHDWASIESSRSVPAEAPELSAASRARAALIRAACSPLDLLAVLRFEGGIVTSETLWKQIRTAR